MNDCHGGLIEVRAAIYLVKGPREQEKPQRKETEMEVEEKKKNVWVASNVDKWWEKKRGKASENTEALTDTGRLDAGPGEIWQTDPGSGALQYVSLLALEVYSAAHLATKSTKNGESQYADANANRLLSSNLKSWEEILHAGFFLLFNDYL